MDHEIRRGIITKLIHAPRMGFNELWSNDGESNKFAYHLKRLEEEGIVGRFDDGYGLTAEGRKLSTAIEGDTGGTVRFPMCGAVVLARRDDGKMLAQQRLKEPYRGVWGLPAGKIPYGWNPDVRAARDFSEETGLVASGMRLRAIEYVTSIEDGEVIHHHLQFLHETWNPGGELIERTHKGLNRWVSPAELRKLPRFPGEFWVGELLTSDDFFVVQTEYRMKDGSIVHHSERIIERYDHGE